MKICLISGTYHPKIGGAESYIRMIAEGLVKKNHEVIVITDGVNVPADPMETINGVKVYRLVDYWQLITDPTKVRWEQMYFSLLSDIAPILKQENIDLIHVNSLDTVILGSMVASSIKVPLVCSFHEQEPEKDPFGDGKCQFIFSNGWVDKFIAGSQFYYDKATRFGVDEKKIQLIYHGINLNQFSPKNKTEMRIKWGIGMDTPTIVSASRLKERKGLLELIRAIGLVKTSVPKVHAIIAGSRNSASSEYADSLYAEIKRLGLEHQVEIMENITFESMPELFAVADLVVQPSYSEGLGLSVLEGMAMCRPVIGTQVVGIQEIITDGEDGLLVPAREVKPLAEAIISLLKDETKRSSLAQKGRQLIENKFNIDLMLGQTLDIYRELI